VVPCSRLFALVYAVGTLVTIFMSNDATAVVLNASDPNRVAQGQRLGPLPYLFVCAFIANAASFLLPISNPANLVVFHNQMPPLGRWLLSYGIPSLSLHCGDIHRDALAISKGASAQPLKAR